MEILLSNDYANSGEIGGLRASLHFEIGNYHFSLVDLDRMEVLKEEVGNYEMTSDPIHMAVIWSDILKETLEDLAITGNDIPILVTVSKWMMDLITRMELMRAFEQATGYRLRILNETEGRLSVFDRLKTIRY